MKLPLAAAFLLGAAMVVWLFFGLSRETPDTPKVIQQLPPGPAKSASDLETARSSAPDGLRENPGDVSREPEKGGRDIEPSNSAVAFPEQRIMETLDGAIDVNALLDAAIHYASLPLDPKFELDYELSDGLTFRFETEEPGVRAYFDIQGEPDYQQDGSWIRRYSVKIHKAPPQTPWIVNGVVREGPRFGISIARDSNGKALYLMAMTHVRVALGDSRDHGINAYQGTHVQGLYYSCYFDPSKPVSCKKMLVVDGQQTMSDQYPLIEAVGTFYPDQEKLNLLKEKVDQLVKEVSK